jgi:hypothetical protein
MERNTQHNSTTGLSGKRVHAKVKNEPSRSKYQAGHPLSGVSILYPLFSHLLGEHKLMLVESELFEIMHICKKIEAANDIEYSMSS